MGWEHDTWAWNANVDTPAECLTLLWLNQRADDNTGVCFPSVADIAANTRLNRKTVFAALKSLTEKGLIETKKRPGPGLRNFYRLCYERTEFGTSQKRNVPKTGLSSSQKRDIQSTENGTSNVPKEGQETTIETTTESIKKQPMVIYASASQTLPADSIDIPFDDALYEAAQLVGSKPNTVKAEAPKRKTTTPRKKPATRCPFDAEATIPDDYRAIAIKVGIGDPQQVFSAFVNHAIAHDRSLVVWPAGFRTWCSNELRYHPNQTPKPKPLHQRTAADYDW